MPKNVQQQTCTPQWTSIEGLMLINQREVWGGAGKEGGFKLVVSDSEFEAWHACTVCSSSLPPK